MHRRIAWMGTLIFATACASAGRGGDVTPVPLYTVGQSVPCEYDVVRTLRRSSAIAPRSNDQYEEMRAQILGTAAAELGADAVIVAPLDPRGIGPAQPRAVAGGPPTAGAEFEGEAIRFRMETCR